MELNSYIAILAPQKHKKHPYSSGAIFIFISFIATVHSYLNNSIQRGIKIILLFSHHSSLFSHSHLSEALSQNFLPKLSLSTSLSQAHSFTTAGLTHPQHCSHRSLTSPTHQLSQAANQTYFSFADQTHFSFANQTHADTILLTRKRKRTQASGEKGHK